MSLFEDSTPAKVKADSTLDTAKKREAARLTRIHCENVLSAPKSAKIGPSQGLFAAEPDAQTSLFE